MNEWMDGWMNECPMFSNTLFLGVWG